MDLTLKTKQKVTRLTSRLPFLLLTMMVFGSLISWGQATLPHHDPLNYIVPGPLQTQAGWTTLNTGDNLAIASGNLTYSGLPSSTGNKLTFDAAGIDAAKLFTQQTTGTVYYSFLLNVTSLGALNTTGGYFTGLNEGTGTTFGATVWTRADGAGYDIGINPRTTAANTVWTSGTTAINTTVFVVISYQLVAGTINDVVKLWINPTPGAAEPAATLTATNTLTDLLNLNRIFIRQDGTTATPFIEMDELRIGTTWASVAPAGSAPVVSPASPTGTVGTPFSYFISATNSPTSYAISSGTLPAPLSLNTTTGEISGTPSTAGSSSVDVTATNGNGTSSPATLSFTINPGSQTITGLPSTDTRTYGDAPYNLTATGGASGNAVTYSASPAGVVTIAGNQVTIVGSGTTTITASQAGNANYNAASDVTQTLTVNQASQTITFGSLAPKPDNAANFQLTATGGGSGIPIVYTSSNPAVAVIVNSLGNPDVNGDWVDVLSAGSTTITANQAGNANYLAASPVQQVQVVTSTSLLPQTITGFAATDTRTYGDANYQLTATGGGSGNPVTYQSLNTAVATIVNNLGNLDPNGTYVHIVSNGVATIRASQAGDGVTYNPAPDVDQVLTVNQKEITITGAVANNKPYDGNNTATITGYTVNGVLGGDDVTVSGGGTFASANAGTWTVTAALTKSGADQSKYYITQPTGLSATIEQLSQTITGLPLTDTRTYGAAPYNLTATGGASGNPVTYESSDPLVATISGNQVTITGAGTVFITAKQAGNTNYSAAADVTQTLTVNQANQTITFAALPVKTIADVPFNLTGTASSGLTVTYTSSNPAVAGVVGNLVTIYTAGTTIITASQAGNTNYLPATNVARTLNVTAPLIAAWDFTGAGNYTNLGATVFNANLSSSNLITRGSGAGASAGANSFRTTGFQNNGISTANTDYFQVTLAATSGKTLSLSDITAKYAGTSTFYAAPGVSSQFAYSLDGTNFTLIGSPDVVISSTLTSMPVINLSGISALQNVPSGTTVTIRYYASGQTATGGWGFNSPSAGDYGLTFGGYVASAPPVVTYTKNNVSVCGGTNDGSITLNATGEGPFTYSWSGGYPGFAPGNVSSVTNLPVGYYNVTVTDVNLNSTTITGIHIENAFLVYVTNSGSISSSCANTGSIILYGNAGVKPYTYSIDGTNYQAGNTFSNLAAGTYTGYVKDAAGCVGTKPNIVIAAAPAIVVSPYVRNASSCANDGKIEIYRNGGIPPYTYSLDNVTYQVSNVFSGLAAGPYTAYVKDSKGCVGSQAATITQGAALVVSATKTNSSTCAADGTIRVNATGGSSPYTYSIDDINYGSSNLFAGLSAGNYTVYVKDVKGCTGSLNVTINLNEIVVTAYSTPASSCLASDGTITLYRSGGVGPYTYSLDGNTYQSGSLFTGIAPGYYEGYVKDSKTCIGQLIDIYVGPDCGQRQAAQANSIASKAQPSAITENTGLSVNAFPNPSNTGFTLNLDGYGNAKVAIIVTDIMGRKVYQAEGNAARQYRFGNNFNPGLYNIQVVQGTDKKTLKVVKQ